jgi:hypothetical protein
LEQKHKKEFKRELELGHLGGWGDKFAIEIAKQKE